MAVTQILARNVASITDLKKDPMGTVRASEGEPIAILNRNQPAFYCISPAMFEQFHALLIKAEEEQA